VVDHRGRQIQADDAPRRRTPRSYGRRQPMRAPPAPQAGSRTCSPA
jgi:hypothetical protein